MKLCLFCGKQINEKRKNALYCSNGCRTNDYRKRKNIAPPDFLKRKPKFNFNSEEKIEIENLQMEIENFNELKKPLQEKLKIWHKRKILFESKGEYKDDSGKIVSDNIVKPKTPDYESMRKKYKRTLKDKTIIEVQQTSEEQIKIITLNYEKEVKKWENKRYEKISNYYYYKREVDEINEEIIKREKRIEEIMLQTELRKRVNESTKTTISGRELLKIQFETLDFTDKWLELMGKPTKSSPVV